MTPVKLNQKKKPKYHNVKTVVDGISFDSKREAARYQQLKLLERKGEISDLRLQVPFELIPSQRIDGKLLEREIKYIADFVYKKHGKTIVEDVKSIATKTKEYIIKRKLMLYNHGIQIVEF